METQNCIGNSQRIGRIGAGEYLRLALTVASRGDLALAASLYRRALCLSPEQPMAHYLLGLALMGMGQADEARSEWQAALRGTEGEQLDWARSRARCLLGRYGSGLR